MKKHDVRDIDALLAAGLAEGNAILGRLGIKQTSSPSAAGVALFGAAMDMRRRALATADVDILVSPEAAKP